MRQCSKVGSDRTFGDEVFACTVDLIIRRVLSGCDADLFKMVWDQPEVYEKDFILWTARQHGPRDTRVFAQVFTAGLKEFKTAASRPSQSPEDVEDDSMDWQVEQPGTVELGTSEAVSVIDSPLAPHIFFWEHSEAVFAVTDMVSLCSNLKTSSPALEDVSSLSLGQIVQLVVETAWPSSSLLQNVKKLREWEMGCHLVLRNVNAAEGLMTVYQKDSARSLRVVHDLVNIYLVAHDHGLHAMVAERLQGFLNRVKSPVISLTRSLIGIKATADVFLTLEKLTMATARNMDVQDTLPWTGGMVSQQQPSSSSSIVGIMNIQSVGSEELCIESDALSPLHHCIYSLESNFWRSCVLDDTDIHNMAMLWEYVLQNPKDTKNMPVMVALLQRGIQHVETTEKRDFATLLLSQLDAGPQMHESLVQTLERLTSDAGEVGCTMLADAFQVCVYDDYLRSCSNLPEIYTHLERSLQTVASGETTILHLVIGAAYIRSVVDVAAKEAIGTTNRHPMLDTLSRALASRQGASGGEGIDASELYFLRCCRTLGLSLKDLQRVCNDLANSHVMPNLANLRWNSLEGNVITFNPLKQFAHYNEAEDTLRKLIQEPHVRRGAQKFILDAARDADRRQAISAAVMALLYIPRAWRHLEECEEVVAEWLHQNQRTIFVGWPKQEQLVVVTLATNAFKNPSLVLEPGMHINQLHTVFLACHLMIVTSGTTSPFKMLLALDQSSMQNAFIPAMESDVTTAILNEVVERGGSVVVYRCICGHTYAVGNCGALNEEGTCPDCDRRIGGGSQNERLRRHTVQEPSHAPGYIIERVEEGERSLYRQVL